MGFCTNCGANVSSESAFCVNCGEKCQNIETQSTEKLVNQNESYNSQQNLTNVMSPKDLVQSNKPSEKVHVATELVQVKKPLSKKTKWLIGILVGLAIIVFGAKYYIDEKYDPNKQLLEMHEAFMDEDKELFYSYFEIPEDTIGGEDKFYDWIDESNWADIRSQIDTELEKLQSKKGMDSIYIGYSDALRLKDEKILFGLAKKISFTIRPLEVSVISEFKGTNVTVNEKTVKTAEEEVLLGKFIQGTYDMSYEYEGPYMPITGEGEIYLYPYDNESKITTEIELEYTTIELYSDYDDAIVFVNDKSTGKTISNLSILEPVNYTGDDKVHLVAKNAAGEEIKSDIYTLSDDYIHFEFEADRELEIQESLTNYYEGFRNSFSYAVNYADYNYIYEYFEAGSQIAQDYQKFVEDHSEIMSYGYDFVSNEVTKFEKISNSEYQLYATEIFDFYSSEDGEINYEREKSYKISIIGDQFIIEEIKDLNTKKTNK